ncbi:hypothetical protein BDB00DRAFT_847020 [Zychaea mexicana]|uniref:uncharacterized protein n=1 Tax=Zychaea mexicana TaxID=64656 RepID=UPI0022FDF7F3|nr:uncharacterized protein BDB00DRAFT_847020 [Zychaea mexicana]KAI9488692.1 hypothetical protein BDB00DRAFT_847020 [Zychaea mexicana]
MDAAENRFNDERPISPWTRTMDRLYSMPPNSDAASSSNGAGARGNNHASSEMIPPHNSDNNDDTESQQQYNKAAAMTTDIPLPQETAIPGPRRKRNNSLIPPELMNDNSEGGRERAALATVFGVREYTESKIFWERQVAAYHQQPSTSSTLEETTEQAHGEEDGFVSITSRSVQSNAIPPASASLLVQTPTPSTSKENNKQAITNLVDSAFENVGHNSHARGTMMDPSTSSASFNNYTTTTTAMIPSFSSSSTHPQQQPAASSTTTTTTKPTVSFSLPDIPVVSEFSDFFDETAFTTKTPSPPPPAASSSGAVVVTRRNLEKKPRPVSFSSSIFTANDPSHYHEIASIPPSITSEQHPGRRYDIAPPLVFIGYPPAIFDLLTSDDDDRIIMWGLDPQVLSASMATTSAAGKKLSTFDYHPPSTALTTPSLTSMQSSSIPASAAASSNKTIKGFSSNTTTASSLDPSAAQPNGNNKSRMPRWSSQLLLPLRNKSKQHLPRPDSVLRFGNSSSSSSSTDPNYYGDKERGGSMLFKFGRRSTSSNGSKRDKQQHRQHRRVIDDDQASVQSVDVPKVIEAATVEKLVEKLTISLDYTFMTDFFLTYRTFISPTQLCKLLILRFRWGLESEEAQRSIVRVRTFVVMRHWLLNYFVHDFIPSRDLRIILTSFLNSLPFHPLIKQSPRDQRIVKSLKRVVRRLKKVYYLSSAESERVKVIAPPPPTQEQERVEEMVRAKLAQSPIRRKTAIVSSVNISDRHHGNMAVQDTGSAPVVVVGSVRNTATATGAAAGVERALTPSHFNGVSGNSNNDTAGMNGGSGGHPPIRRNVSSTSITRFGRHSKQQDIEAVKASYLRRMEQQKKAMDQQAHDTATLPASAEGADLSSQASVVTDDSLESALSPGTTDDELSQDDYSEDENEKTTTTTPTEEQLAIRLERERRRREEEEEQNRAEFFSPSSAVSGESSLLAKVPTSSASIQSGSELVNKPSTSPSEEDIVQELSVNDHPRRQPLEEAASVTARARQQQQQSPVAAQSDVPGTTTKTPTKRNVKEGWKFAYPQQQQQQQQSTRRILGPARDTHVHPTEIVKTSNGQSQQQQQQQSTVNIVAQQLRAGEGSQVSDSVAGEDEINGSDNQLQARRTSTIQRRKGHSGPVYLSQLARRSITSGDLGGVEGEEEEGPVLQIQEVDTTTTEGGDETTTTMTASDSNKTHQARMSVTSAEVGLGTPPRTPQRIVELDLPKPQLMNSNAPSMTTTPSMMMRRSSDHPRSFILYYRSERMARQLCLVEAQVLLNIDWEEMVHCRWTKMGNTDALDDMSEFTAEEEEDEDDLIERDRINYTRRTRQMRLARGENHGGIEQVIKRFNDVCQWVASEIVHTRALDERVKVVEKFIRLAQKCKLYCNFATLVQILLGLQSPAVSRLKRTWDRVGSHEMRILDQLSAFTSPMKNWKNIRDSMTQVAEDYGMSPVEVQIEMPGTNHHAFTKTKIKIPFGGCIPFLGIYLSDLVFNSEQQPYIQPSHDHHRIYQANNVTNSHFTSPVLKQPLVNFRKHRITATVIKRVLTFQNLARRYSFERDDEVYFLCAELHSSNADEVRKLSHDIEP